LIVPREVHHTPTPEPVEAPKVVMNQFAAPQIKMTSGGARPQLLHTGDFAGSSVAPTVNAAVQKVQTGGFGDPNGLKGTGKEGAKLYAAPTGSFDMPVGPGQGNGSGGAKGIKGTVASADFGNGIATGSKGDGRSSGVSTGGFGAEQVVHGGPKIAQADSGPPTSSVEITFKPNPVYTDEARSLKLEGEVLLEVTFSANGTLHVSRVVRGLGHGLDEAAIAAAKKMRFKPALRNGQPMDSTAVVHVLFQMAY
jgi:TonB family protein